MSALNREDLHRLARLGARARLEELLRETAAIRRAFPDLFGKAKPAVESAPTPRPVRRRGMSAAARKAVSERMKKYWAARRKAKTPK